MCKYITKPYLFPMFQYFFESAKTFQQYSQVFETVIETIKTIKIDINVSDNKIDCNLNILNYSLTFCFTY